jgi:hypothetical protein
MASKEFQECLIDVYRGELTGEVAFESMLGSAETDEERYVLGTMLQFETEGKAMIRPLLMRLGLPMFDDPNGRSDGVAASTAMNSLPWLERFGTMREIVEANYLPRYEELAMLITAEEDSEAARIATFMGNHERALVQLADNIIAGRPDPAAPVAKLLHFPLPRPG